MLSGAIGRLSLPARVVKGELREIRRDLLECLHSGTQALEIDTANVLEIDGCGIQLLLAAAKSGRAQNKSLQLLNRSAVMEHATAVHHVKGVLGL